MSIFQVFDMRKKVIKREGAGAVCPCCGGPVVATLLDCNLHVCCIPVSRKTKTKYFCAICSRPLTLTTR
ncbi:hypothetical protein PVL29_004640 [Vitis rotundifolia]|uniref:Uncharacterized protein n=1 Tax=Vitis rotundifolia TaxID=103349 RepID=A0AA39DZW6_VITRO|nr:hypothetical protein PVL29_004640 [Vitis rotundifolia]